MSDNELLLAISEMLDKELDARLKPIENRVKRIEVDLLESQVIPRLNTMNVVDWFYKTFEVDIDSLKEITGRDINIDSEVHKQKSVYEIYAEQTTVEEMEKAWKTFQKEK